MKKFLLLSAAAIVAASASAAEVVLAESDFATASSYYFWAQGTEPKIENGGLTITNEAATENFWNVQYIVADNMAVTAGREYTVSVKIKGFSGSLHYVLGAWGSDVFSGAANVEDKADWQTITFGGTASADIADGVHLLLQSGDFVGSYTIANVKITYNKEEGGETPVEPGAEKVLAQMYPGSASLIGWGLESNREVVTEDGKECLKVNNPTAGQSWEAQIAYDYNFEAGTTYYISMDVKGDAGTITSGYQQTDGYKGCGNFSNFTITEDWNTVTISGVAGTSENGDPNRWVANIGDYVGTFYISNLKLYVLEGTAVNAIATEKVAMEGVYNLNGVKVLNNANELNTLPKGVYIVNGKKIVR